MELKNKTILITGASSGIGQAIAIACAKQGATVLINYRSSKQGAEETLKQVEQFSKGFIFQADLIDQTQVSKMFEEIFNKVGAIDCLVNNAGEAKGGDFFTDEIWHYEIENILFSAVHCIQRFIKQGENIALRKIVNISSVYGNLIGASSDLGYAPYSAAKSAIQNMTVALAKNFENVLINAVAPGRVLTPAWGELSKAEKKDLTADTIIKRFIEPEEIAQTVVYLLENDAVTGQIITVDGGLLLKNI